MNNLFGADDREVAAAAPGEPAVTSVGLQHDLPASVAADVIRLRNVVEFRFNVYLIGRSGDLIC